MQTNTMLCVNYRCEKQSIYKKYTNAVNQPFNQPVKQPRSEPVSVSRYLTATAWGDGGGGQIAVDLCLNNY